MSATNVTVLCPNGRRVNVKATPATVLLQVLEQACAKQKMDPVRHVLKHHGKVLDLDCSYRYSGLPQNSKLDLELSDDPPRSKEGTVLLAVQSEDGQRRQAEFPPSTTLWDALEQLGLQDKEELGDRTADEEGRRRWQPVVVYMSHQVEGKAGLQERTLRALGISSGRAVVRLLFREGPAQQIEDKTTKSSPKEQPSLPGVAAEEGVASVQTTPITQATPTRITLSDEEPKPKPSHSEPMEEELPYFPAHPIRIFPEDEQPHPLQDQQPDALFLPEQVIPQLMAAVQPFRFPDAPVVSRQQQPGPPAPTVRSYDEPCDRQLVVYRRDDALPVTPTEELPPSFFDVTVTDVHKMHSDLKRQVELADAPLLTSTQRQAKLERQGSQYDKSVLRVYLPDGWVLQGCFRPRESLKAVVRFVRDNLADPKTKFHLYTTPPKHILRSGKLTLLEAGFVPAAVVHVGLEEEGRRGAELLAPHTLQLAQSSLQAHITATQNQPSQASITTSERTPRPEKPASSQPGPTHPPSAAAATGSGQPKWFKLGKK